MLLYWSNELVCEVEDTVRALGRDHLCTVKRGLSRLSRDAVAEIRSENFLALFLK